jgi:hypothetical protein
MSTPNDHYEILLKRLDLSRQERAERLPDAKSCLSSILDARERLIELGWREMSGFPTDGTSFWTVEAGSTGIHDTVYSGEYPNGYFFVQADGDLWPSKPILWKPKD